MINKKILVVQLFDNSEYLVNFMKAFAAVICDDEKMSLKKDIKFILYGGDRCSFLQQIRDCLKTEYPVVLLATDRIGFKQENAAVPQTTLFEDVICTLENELGETAFQFIHTLLCCSPSEPLTEGKRILDSHQLMYDVFMCEYGTITSYPAALTLAVKSRLHFFPGLVYSCFRVINQNYLNEFHYISEWRIIPPSRYHMVARWLAEYERESHTIYDYKYAGNFSYDGFLLYPEYQKQNPEFATMTIWEQMMNNSIYAPLIRRAADRDVYAACLVVVLAGEGSTEIKRDFFAHTDIKDLWKYIYYHSYIISKHKCPLNTDVLLAMFKLLERHTQNDIWNECVDLKSPTISRYNVVCTLIYELEFNIVKNNVKDNELYFFSVLSQMLADPDSVADDLTAYFLGLKGKEFFCPERAALFQLFPRKSIPPMYKIMYLMAEKFHGGKDKRFPLNIPLAVRLYNAALSEYAPRGCSKAAQALYIYFMNGNSTEDYLRVYAPLIKGVENDGQTMYLKYLSRIRKKAIRNEKNTKVRKNNE